MRTKPLFLFITTLAAVAVPTFFAGFARPAAAAAGAVTTSAVVSLAAGDEHTCALHADGVVQCWGSNAFGQLGNEDVAASSTPVPAALPADAHIVAIAAGGFHTCAVARDHRVFCWGSNDFGQLGLGVATSQTVPQLVTLAPSDAVATDVAAGGFTSCALLSNGGAQCWGRNQYGEVGDATRTLRNVPTPVIGLTDALDIDAGDNHVCILRAVGKMQCWGRSADGRTGDSTMANVAQVSAGGAHTCARTTVGALRCWGLNSFGQLTPNDIDSGVAQASAGGSHTCVAGDSGGVKCWGDASLGQLGEFDAQFTAGRVVEVASGARHTCARFDDASVWCWGHSLFGQAGDHVLTAAARPVLLIEGAIPAQNSDPAPSDPAPSDPAQSEPAPTSPADNDPAPAAPVADAPVGEAPATATPVVPVEKQASAPGAAVATPEAPATVTSPGTSSPSSGPSIPSIPRLRYVDVRLGQQVSIARLARTAGIRLPSTLIVGSLSRARSVSAHPFHNLRVEATVSNPRNCRNVLTPTLTAAVRAIRVGECRVTLRIARAARPALVRTVVLRTAAFAVPANNPARNTR